MKKILVTLAALIAAFTLALGVAPQPATASSCSDTTWTRTTQYRMHHGHVQRRFRFVIRINCGFHSTQIRRTRWVGLDSWADGAR